ncbi:MAG TPA: amidohydrolase family protein [Phycisphaerales bacterium]|nr:amidohydrolase family protein [Phycisphaerales bacterium]
MKRSIVCIGAAAVAMFGSVGAARQATDAASGEPAPVFIDLKDRFVMPGLIDCHTHITGQYSRDVRLRRVVESDADAAVRGVVYAERTLMAGFTTIRNVGSSGPRWMPPAPPPS